MTTAPLVKLSNSRQIPLVGLETHMGYLYDPELSADAVRAAIDNGYRLFDCSPIYGNEKYVGIALNEKMRDKVVKRKELFIITKVWITNYKSLSALDSLRASLKALKLDYVDLFLLSWPFAHTNNVDYGHIWFEMESCVEKKLTKGIGVCNFNCEQIDRLHRYTAIFPAVNQVECHINLNQKELIKFCKERDIAVMGYAPFGNIHEPRCGPYSDWKSDENVTLDTPDMNNLARKYKKSVHQIALRYLTQQGVITIPSSSSLMNIVDNINIFDFELTQEELLTIDKLNCNKRIVTASQYANYDFYPF